MEVTSANFDEVVIKGSHQKPVLVKFWAEWCGPCNALGTTIDLKKEELEQHLTIVSVNVDEESELASQFSIRNIPAMLVFKNGDLNKRQIGVLQGDNIVKVLTENL